MQLEQELPAPGYNGYLDAIALCHQTCGRGTALLSSGKSHFNL
jgi:hypothetical protein